MASTVARHPGSYPQHYPQHFSPLRSHFSSALYLSVSPEAKSALTNISGSHRARVSLEPLSVAFTPSLLDQCHSFF